MANWQRKILLNPEWSQAQDNEITVQALAASIAKKLRAVSNFTGSNADLNDTRDEIADEFEWLSEDDSAGRDDFDCLMSSLYDWGDQKLDENWNGKKVCWVDTMSSVTRAPSPSAHGNQAEQAPAVEAKGA